MLPCGSKLAAGFETLNDLDVAVRATDVSAPLTRTRFYDGIPDEGAKDDRVRYWRAIELLPDTDLGFGAVRKGLGRQGPRQKAIDTLVAVDMLVGAFTKLFLICLLVAGDADYLPVVDEVRRCGVMVVLAGGPASDSRDLKAAADRFIAIVSQVGLPPLELNGDLDPFRTS